MSQYDSLMGFNGQEGLFTLVYNPALRFANLESGITDDDFYSIIEASIFQNERTAANVTNNLRTLLADRYFNMSVCSGNSEGQRLLIRLVELIGKRLSKIIFSVFFTLSSSVAYLTSDHHQAPSPLT